MQCATMLLRLNGLEETALSYSGTDNFADAGPVTREGGQRILAYLRAHPEYGFTGTGNNNFSPTDSTTAQQFYKVLLTALGYQQGTDFTWQNTLTFAQSRGLPDTGAIINGNYLTMNDVSIITLGALTASPNGETGSLISSLVSAGTIPYDKAVASGLMPAKAPETQTPTVLYQPVPPIPTLMAGAPTFSVESYIDYNLTLSVNCSTPSASIYYTYKLNGEQPETPAVDGADSHSAAPGDTIVISTDGCSVTINAIAVAPGMYNSTVISFTYSGEEG